MTKSETKTKSEIILLLAWQLQQKALQIKEICELYCLKRGTAHNYMHTIQRVYNVERQGNKYLITDKKPKIL